MKNFLLLLLALLTSLSHAQMRVTDFNNFTIKGHIQQLSEYNFDKVDSANVDTADCDRRDITTFDAAGNRIKQVSKYHGYSTVFLFENTDSTISESGYAEINVYTYNKKGREISRRVINLIANDLVDATTPVMFYYTYDARGNRIEEDQFYRKTLFQKITYLFNDKGQEIEQDDSKTRNSPATKYISEYDTAGNMVKQVGSNADGTDVNEDDITYDFIDKNGNWLRRESTNSKSHKKHITIRVIDYY